MRTRFFSGICKLVVFLLLFSGLQVISIPDTVWAEEWVWKFKVPVELKNIPDKPNLKYINVMITLFDTNGKEMTTIKKSNLPIKPDGTFSEVVEVIVYESNIPSQWVAADAVKYQASFNFTDGKGNAFPPNTKVYPYSKSMPGTKFVGKVEGSLLNIKIFPEVLKGKK
jgi:hypothetical protein